MSVRRRARRIGLIACALWILLAPLRGMAAELDTVGLLWLPDEMAPPVPAAVVIALHDALGVDPRAWPYAEQLTAAGIAVLHVELLDVSADGYRPAPARAEAAAADAAEARARLLMLIDMLAEDSRFATAPIGLLSFGASGQAALHVAADPVHGGRIAALALLYPGCAGLIDQAAGPELPRAPILLLHGDADPANTPADCGALAALLGDAVPVRRREYPGAGYAWDHPSRGLHEVVKLPWPGRAGWRLPVRPWPAATEVAAAQVAAFFAAVVTPPRVLPTGVSR